MYNVIKYLILLTTAVFVFVNCQNEYGCYRQPTSPCSHHTLTCPDDQVLAFDESGDVKISYGRNYPGYACPQVKLEICNATCCRHQHRNEYVRVNETDRLSVYRNCSNQPNCTVTSPYSPGTDYDYIRYPYICVPVNETYNMMEITDVSFLSEGYLHYSGKTQTTGKKITRCCNITSPEPIEVESVYIDLTEESSHNVKIYSDNQTLLRCIDAGGIFHGFGELSMSGDKIYHVVLDNLPFEEDGFIWLKIESNSPNISITCGDDCPTSEITQSSEDQLGLIIGCVVGIVVVVVVAVAVYCIIRRRRSKSCNNHQALEYSNNNNNRIESNEYDDTIHDDNAAHQDRHRGVIAATPPRITPAYCDPWESCIKLEPRSDPRTPPVDSKVKYSVVKPMSTRRQGEGKPSEYDHISTKTIAVNMGTEEELDTDYDHFKHNSLNPVVRDNTYYDHIPNSGVDPRPKPFSDPTYDHLGEKGVTKKPQDKAVNLNQTSSNSQYQPHKSRAKVDDPYTDPTYNHLRVKDPIRHPQREHTTSPKPASNWQYRTKKTVDDPYGDSTYNHLNVKGHTTKQQQENVAGPNNDPTYNHLGETDPTTKPQQQNRTKENFVM